MTALHKALAGAAVLLVVAAGSAVLALNLGGDRSPSASVASPIPPPTVPLSGAAALRLWEPPDASEAFNRVVNVNNSAKVRVDLSSPEAFVSANNARYWGELADAARTAKVTLDEAPPAPAGARVVIESLRQSLRDLELAARNAGACSTFNACMATLDAATAARRSWGSAWDDYLRACECAEGTKRA